MDTDFGKGNWTVTKRQIGTSKEFRYHELYNKLPSEVAKLLAHYRKYYGEGSWEFIARPDGNKLWNQNDRPNYNYYVSYYYPEGFYLTSNASVEAYKALPQREYAVVLENFRTQRVLVYEISTTQREIWYQHEFVGEYTCLDGMFWPKPTMTGPTRFYLDETELITDFVNWYLNLPSI